MSIAPIETRYAGCRFRSRLEARWAVFFDHLGIEWEYEPEGYVVNSKPYLPDFKLTGLGAGFDLWFEVKGQYPTRAEIEKAQGLADGTGVLTFIQFGGVELPDYPMPKTIGEFWEHETNWSYFPQAGWRQVQGPLKWEIGIPPCAIRLDPGSARPDGLSRPWWWAECSGCSNFIITAHGWAGGCPATELPSEVDASMVHNFDSPRLKAAYRAARSARFEHGECG